MRKPHNMLLDQLPDDVIYEILYRTDTAASLDALSLTSRRIGFLSDSDIVWKNKFKKDFPEASRTSGAEISTCKITKSTYLDYLKFKLRNQAQEIMRLGMLLTNNKHFIAKIDTAISIPYLFAIIYPPFGSSSSFHEEFKSVLGEKLNDKSKSFQKIINISQKEINSIDSAYRDRKS